MLKGILLKVFSFFIESFKSLVLLDFDLKLLCNILIINDFFKKC